MEAGEEGAVGQDLAEIWGKRQAGGSRLLPATPSYPCQWTFLEAPLSSLSKNPENHFISS